MIFEDRQYQIDTVNHSMNHGREMRPIYCAPTGSGKTIIQAKVCKREMERGDATAILTPRNEIFVQTHGVASEICGARNITILRAKRVDEHWDPTAPIHVCSWHTIISRAKRSDFWFPKVKRVLVDEAHLSMAPKILEILEHYAPKAIVDGYTATPARMTGKGLGRFYTEIKHVTSVRQLIKDGYLCPVEYWGGNTPDLAGLKISRGDYEIKKLSDRMVVLVGDAVDNFLRLASERHTIVFAVDIAHAEMLAHRFNYVGIKAAALHTKLDDADRDEVNVQFKSQQIQVLVNVGIASYGYDAPSVSCIQICRPTKSIVLHLQMIGRGMRPGIDADGERITDPDDPDFKTCMVLDHAGNVPALGMADDLFRWRLDEGKKAMSRVNEKGEPQEIASHTCNDCGHIFQQSRVCPMCGWKVPFAKRDVAVKDADLVLIGKSMTKKLPTGFPTHQIFYQMLMHNAHRLNKPKMAKAQYKEKCESWPPWHWDNLAHIPPDKRVKGWIHSRRIAFAAVQKKLKAERQTQAAG